MQIHILAATALVVAGLFTSATPRAQAPTKTDEVAWSDELQKSATAWAERFVQRLRAGEFDPDAGLGIFDREAIAAAALDGVESDDKDMLTRFRDGLVTGMQRTDQALFEQWSAGQPKFKRVLLVDGRPVARMRVAGDNGVSILDFPLVRKGDEWRAVDMRNHAVGLSMVEGMRQNVLVMMPGLDAGVLARLLGAGKDARNDATHMKAMVEHQLKGEFASAVAEHRKLSKEMKATGIVTALHLTCLGMLDDEDAYAAALEQAAKDHPAPKFRLMLVDAHFVRQRWDAAIACVDEFMAAIERDAALLTMRAMLQLQAGRVGDAQKSMQEAIDLEADCEYALSSGLDVWLAAEDWATVRDAIVALEKHHGYAFAGQLTDDVWAGFRAAPESEPWR